MAGSRRLFEKLRSDVLGAVNDGTDFDVIRLNSVEDQMGLKAEASIAQGQLINALTNAREVGKKSTRAN